MIMTDTMTNGTNDRATTGRLRGKVALITGGGQGIGQATALLFAREGARVMIGNRDTTAGETVVHPFAETAELDDEAFSRVMDINVRGVWLSMKHEIPAMLAGGGGSIIDTASVLGLTAVPNNAAYVAGKHAVIGLTKVAALEYGARGVRVNALSPAVTDTAMARSGLMAGDTDEAAREARRGIEAAHPIGRIAAPEEVAEAALWLAGPESSFFLGQSLTLDGGWSAQ